MTFPSCHINFKSELSIAGQILTLIKDIIYLTFTLEQTDLHQHLLCLQHILFHILPYLYLHKNSSETS